MKDTLTHKIYLQVFFIDDTHKRSGVEPLKPRTYHVLKASGDPLPHPVSVPLGFTFSGFRNSVTELGPR